MASRRTSWTRTALHHFRAYCGRQQSSGTGQAEGACGEGASRVREARGREGSRGDAVQARQCRGRVQDRLPSAGREACSPAHTSQEAAEPCAARPLGSRTAASWVSRLVLPGTPSVCIPLGFSPGPSLIRQALRLQARPGRPGSGHCLWEPGVTLPSLHGYGGRGWKSGFKTTSQGCEGPSPILSLKCEALIPDPLAFLSGC